MERIVHHPIPNHLYYLLFWHCWWLCTSWMGLVYLFRLTDSIEIFKTALRKNNVCSSMLKYVNNQNDFEPYCGCRTEIYGLSVKNPKCKYWRNKNCSWRGLETKSDGIHIVHCLRGRSICVIFDDFKQNYVNYTLTTFAGRHWTIVAWRVFVKWFLAFWWTSFRWTLFRRRQRTLCMSVCCGRLPWNHINHHRAEYIIMYYVKSVMWQGPRNHGRKNDIEKPSLGLVLVRRRSARDYRFRTQYPVHLTRPDLWPNGIRGVAN